MARQFVRMKFAAMTDEVCVNQDHILGFMPNGKPSGFFVWLTHSLQVSNDAVQRHAQLAGVAPLSKDVWEVTSSDLAGL